MENLIVLLVLAGFVGFILYKNNKKVKDFVDSKLPQKEEKPVEADFSPTKPFEVPVNTPLPTNERSGTVELPMQPREPVLPGPTPTPAPMPVPEPVPTPAGDPFAGYPSSLPSLVTLDNVRRTIHPVNVDLSANVAVMTLDVKDSWNGAFSIQMTKNVTFDSPHGLWQVLIWDQDGRLVYSQEGKTDYNFALTAKPIAMIPRNRPSGAYLKSGVHRVEFRATPVQRTIVSFADY